MEHLTSSIAFKSTKSTKPFKTKLYIRILDVTSSIKEEYKEFIKGKPTLI